MFPSGWTVQRPTTLQGSGWGTMILPELEQSALVGVLSMTESLTSTYHKTVLMTQVSPCLCPSDPFPQVATVRVREPEFPAGIRILAYCTVS